MTDKIEIPESITKSVYAFLEVSSYNPGQITVSTIDYRMWFDDPNYGDKYVFLAEQEITIKLPKKSENEVRQEIVNGLEKQKETIDAKAYAAKRTIQDKIDALLQIEYHVES